MNRVQAEDLAAGMTVHIGGRYRELAAVGGDAEGRVLLVTRCTRGYVLDQAEQLRIRPTDRALAA